MNMPTGPAASNWPESPQSFPPQSVSPQSVSPQSVPQSQQPFAQQSFSPPVAGPVRKPATVAVTMWLGVVVGVLTIVGALIMILSGKDTIRAYVAKTVNDTLGTDVDPALINATVGDELDAAYHKLVIKAVVAIVVAVLILVFALVARNASTGGRVGLTIALVVGMCAGSGLQFVDLNVIPSASVAIAALTPMLSLIAIICAFLPATNSYAKARKGVR